MGAEEGGGSGTGDPGGSSKDAKEKGPANKAQNPGSGDRRSPGAATTSSSGSSSKRRAARNVHIAPESPTTHRMGSFSSSPGGFGSRNRRYFSDHDPGFKQRQPERSSESGRFQEEIS